MKNKLQFSKGLLMLFLAFSFQTSFAQVTLTATSGTATGSFTTLKGAFDAINLGTHKGVIEIKINANTNETASASLTASAALATSAPFYTSVTIYPTTTGLIINGNLPAPLINLNGADNVTIDGRVNTTGSTKSLTITNKLNGAMAGTSTIRFIGDASNNTVQYCNLQGSSNDASAGIVFFSTATTTGNDNNTITNNDITSAALFRPLNAVFALGTTLKNNDNNTISNNNIFNFLSRETASQGINISSYNSAFTISGNSFYQWASFSPSAAVAYNVILINAVTGAGNGFTVSDNYIGGSEALCAGTAWTKPVQNNAFTAISVTTATGTANSIQGNTIQNFNWTNAGTSDFTGISLTGATVANIGTVTANTIGAETGTGSITFTSTTTATDFYGINIASTDVVNCQNNSIGAIKVDNAATNATNFYGIYKSATAGTTTISNNIIGSTTTANSINASSASSTAANIQSVYGIQSAGTGTVTIDGNTIANMVNATSNATTTAAGLISGIYVSAGTNTISNNTVRDLSIANANTNILSTPSVSGIVMASTTAAAQTVSGNTVHSLSNSFASFAGGVIGIYYNGPTTASAVRGNFIHSLSASGASSTTADLYGIKINAGATKYSNNIISLGGDTKTDLFGIYQTGAASNNNSLFYNTVYISGSLVSGATNTSYALYSTAITNTRDFRNNIFVNARSTVSGASKHYAIWIAASGGTITCNYNNYFVSGTGGVLGYFAADKTALPIVTSNDANSIITNPTFSSAGGTTATNYTPTVSGVAVTGTGITVDYASNTRATNVTMGAYELKLGPNTPTDVVATAGLSSASISFTAPTNIGGGPITNYQYSLDNGSSWVTPSPAVTASPLSIDGLVNCTAYSIKIRAVNATGGGTASSTLTVTPQNGQPAGVNWISNTTASGSSWACVTYGEGIFVALTNVGGRVMTSPDGISWNIVTLDAAFNKAWLSVTYGNGIFVAVATGNNSVMTSPDGITWTIQTTISLYNQWKSVTYGNGLFVAVGLAAVIPTKNVMTSPDGITWTIQTSAAGNTWTSVTYGNGLFVAVAQTGTGNRVMTSPDGITWTIQTSAADNWWKSVTYGNELFVAVAYTGTDNRVMTSANGINWTIRTAAADLYWNSVTYDNGLFVAVGEGGGGIGNTVMTSPDGITWTTRAPAMTLNWQTVTFGNKVFVALANNGSNTIMTSADVLAPSNPTINSITPSATSASVAFTAPASSGFSAITGYQYSLDNGSNWVTPSPALTASPFTISGLTSGTTYNVQLRAINSIGFGCGSSTVNTTTIVPTVPNAPTSVGATAGVNAAYIAFTAPTNDGGAEITTYEYTINNGGTWTPVASTISPLYITGLTACTEYSIKIRAVNVVGGGSPSAAVTVTPENGQLPGIKWTSRTSANDNLWSSVTYGNGLFVAVASSGTGNRVMTSPDGITWTIITSAAGNSWRSVTYGNGLFVAVSSDGTGNRVMTSPNGITWTSRTSAANNAWNSIAYGNGLFVAVSVSGTGNRVMTSPDGITWTIQTSATDNNWYSVTYGNGLFVAVSNSGTGNRVMTSPDGITWTSRTSAEDNQWVSVTYGNGLFVAVSISGTGNRVMTSTNGIDWTSRASAVDNTWFSVTYGNGLFVAVSYSGVANKVMTSPNGITWTSRTSANDNQWYSVTYGNGLFVAVGQSGTGNRVMTSSDAFAPGIPSIGTITPSVITALVAFTPPASAGSSAISNYEYSIDNGSTWVTPSPAVTTSPLTITGLTTGTTYPIKLRAVNTQGFGCSSEALNTTTLTVTPPNEPSGISVAAGVRSALVSFTAPTSNGNGEITNYQYSLNNDSWVALSPEQAATPLNVPGLEACTTYSLRIRAVNSAGAGTPSAEVSVTPQNGQESGINWTSRTSAADNQWTGITYGNGLFVAVASTGVGNRVMTSPDGITWTSRTSAANNTWNGITYGKGLFVAVAGTGTGNRVMTSPDGITWTSRTSAANNVWFAITYGNGLFVAVAGTGTGNRVMTSPDGITWTSRTSAADNQWYGITYGNGLFVAVAGTGTDNRVMTSPDGISWTSRTSAENIEWSSITYGNGLFVAVAKTGVGNRVMTSPDGITWTSRTSAADNVWSGITYGNGLFVAVGTSGTDNPLMTSPDGTTWTSRTYAAYNRWNSITYGNGLFVAVAISGVGNRVMTSSDLFSPDSPSITAITPAATTATVVFTAPASIGSSVISNYQYSIDNGSTWVTPSPAVTTSPLNIAGLTSGTSYNIQVRAVNSAGASCGSIMVSTTTLSAAPAAPTAAAQTFCTGKTVADLVATGTNLKWYADATGGTALVSTTALATRTYYVSQTVSGNESARTSVAVTVNSATVPTFTQVGAICQGETLAALPTTSNNSVTGAWSPVVNNTVTTLYTFTPTAGSCASTATMSIEVGATTTWNGTTWDNGAPTSISKAVISGNYSVATNLTACSLEVSGTAIVTVPSGYNFNVSGAVTVATTASMTIENNANLLQQGITNLNSGNITVNRYSAPLLRLDHTFWSTPVTGSKTLQQFSPNTLPNRFYNYTTSSNSFTATPATSTFTPGKGVCIRTSDVQSSTVPSPFLGVFTGVPNSGNISFTLATNAINGFNYNLVGNPYPSTINAAAVLAANSNVAGAIYFYTHSLTMNSSGLFPAGTNYTTLNSLGHTLSTRIAGDPHLIPEVPNGFIQIGQGFIVRALSAGNFTFTNAMRTNNQSNQFLRTTETEKHRIWLNLLTETGDDINQMMVGYVEGATQGVDSNFDALSIGSSGTSLSSKIEGLHYSIQGRSLPFSSNDIVPLTFKALASGNYKISLNTTDGLFAGSQGIFIRDNLLGIDHNIKESPYAFSSVTGTFDARFELVYTQALGIPSSDFTSNSVIVYRNTDWFHVNTKGIIMKDIQVFDISGRLIYNKVNINATKTVLDGLTKVNEVLFLKITSEDNATVTVKVIN